MSSTQISQTDAAWYVERISPSPAVLAHSPLSLTRWTSESKSQKLINLNIRRRTMMPWYSKPEQYGTRFLVHLLYHFHSSSSFWPAAYSIRSDREIWSWKIVHHKVQWNHPFQNLLAKLNISEWRNKSFPFHNADWFESDSIRSDPMKMETKETKVSMKTNN